MEEDQIVEIWDMFREYISEKNRETAANHFVDYLIGRDVELEVLEGLMGYDPHLDSAISLVIDADDSEETDIDEDWDPDEEEEE